MSNASEALFAPLQLKSGQVLRNRIAKAAMEEGMAGRAQLPGERLIALYRQWGAGEPACSSPATSWSTRRR